MKEKKTMFSRATKANTTVRSASLTSDNTMQSFNLRLDRNFEKPDDLSKEQMTKTTKATSRHQKTTKEEKEVTSMKTTEDGEKKQESMVPEPDPSGGESPPPEDEGEDSDSDDDDDDERELSSGGDGQSQASEKSAVEDEDEALSVSIIFEGNFDVVTVSETVSNSNTESDYKPTKEEERDADDSEVDDERESEEEMDEKIKKRKNSEKAKKVKKEKEELAKFLMDCNAGLSLQYDEMMKHFDSTEEQLQLNNDMMLLLKHNKDIVVTYWQDISQLVTDSEKTSEERGSLMDTTTFMRQVFHVMIKIINSNKSHQEGQVKWLVERHNFVKGILKKLKEAMKAKGLVEFIEKQLIIVAIRLGIQVNDDQRVQAGKLKDGFCLLISFIKYYLIPLSNKKGRTPVSCMYYPREVLLMNTSQMSKKKKKTLFNWRTLVCNYPKMSADELWNQFVEEVKKANHTKSASTIEKELDEALMPRFILPGTRDDKKAPHSCPYHSTVIVYNQQKEKEKNKGGRPKGSKNRKTTTGTFLVDDTIIREAYEEDEDEKPTTRVKTNLTFTLPTTSQLQPAFGAKKPIDTKKKPNPPSQESSLSVQEISAGHLYANFSHTTSNQIPVDHSEQDYEITSSKDSSHSGDTELFNTDFESRAKSLMYRRDHQE